MTNTRCRPPLLILLALLGSACAGTPGAATPETSAALWPRIVAQVGHAPCDSQAQCHSIGVGHKPCGGPGGYLAWSSKQTDEAALKALVERHAKLEAEEQARSGMLSNCQYLPDPGASCVAGRCQLNKAGPASSTR
ncbi:MAG: hypothetical protein IV092_02160 [Burkholderiaceae bacterium]|nr:hypothetical protein [Burkholderiaceae bacterium]